MGKIDKQRMMQDIGKLYYGKNEETFSLEKFLKSIQEAPVIQTRLIKRDADEWSCHEFVRARRNSFSN